jgi:hypothetical protein
MPHPPSPKNYHPTPITHVLNVRTQSTPSQAVRLHQNAPRLHHFAPARHTI